MSSVAEEHEAVIERQPRRDCRQLLFRNWKQWGKERWTLSPPIILYRTREFTDALLRKAHRWSQRYLIIRFARYFWFVFAQVISLIDSVWFISKFAQLIILAIFISFQVKNLVVKEKHLHQLDLTLMFKLKMCSVDQASCITYR